MTLILKCYFNLIVAITEISEIFQIVEDTLKGGDLFSDSLSFLRYFKNTRIERPFNSIITYPVLLLNKRVISKYCSACLVYYIL